MYSARSGSSSPGRAGSGIGAYQHARPGSRAGDHRLKVSHLAGEDDRVSRRGAPTQARPVVGDHVHVRGQQSHHRAPRGGHVIAARLHHHIGPSRTGLDPPQHAIAHQRSLRRLPGSNPGRRTVCSAPTPIRPKVTSQTEQQRLHARWRRSAPVTQCDPVLGPTSRGSPNICSCLRMPARMFQRPEQPAMVTRWSPPAG